MLGKNPKSVQNAITLVKKKDAELCIIEGMHNHDPEHKINHFSNKQHQSKSNNPGPCHCCSGPHLIRDCEDSVCKRCKPNLDDSAPARCPIRKFPAKQQHFMDQDDTSLHRNQSNGHNDPALQLSVSTTKPNYNLM